MIRKALFVVTVIYTILLITRPQEFIPGLSTLPLLQVIVLTAFGIWALMPDKGLELPQFRLAPLFLLSVWLSLGIGGGWWGGIVPALEKLLPSILLFVIVTGCVRSVRELRIYSAVVIACACVLVLHGHLQTTTGIGWTGQPMVRGRITYSGIFDDPNDIGLLIVTSLALAIFHCRTQGLWLARALFAGAIGWLLYGVYLTDSRGTMLAALLIIGLEMWRAFGKIVAGICAAAAIPVLVAFTRLSQLDTQDESAAGRFEAWYDGMQFLRERPIFGVGWDNFIDYAYGITAHNSWMLAMAELGILGYTFWFAFVTLTGWMSLRLAFPASPGPAVEEPRPQFAASALLSPGLRARAAVPSQMAARERSVAAARVHVPDSRMLGHASGRLERGKQPPGKRPDAVPAPQQSPEQLAAFYLLLAASGFALGAFFLSQSYKAMLFLNCGLIVGRFLGAREAGSVVPEYLGRGMHLPLMFGLALASVVSMWLLIKVLV
jgi:putative inorganic carbon (HCO3(-)) transporter